MNIRTITALALAGAASLLVAGAAAGFNGHDRHAGDHAHSAQAFFERAGHRGGQGRRRAAATLFRYLDADGNGALARTEAEGVIRSGLGRFDGDGDTTLALEEFAGLWAEFSRPRMVDAFQRLDEDGDGRVTEAEMTGPLDRLFRFGDVDEDGTIDAGDLRQRRGLRGGFGME
ncbi:MAG: hypothetical protein AAGI34_00380 [Pseudomonadota bacterium]